MMEASTGRGVEPPASTERFTDRAVDYARYRPSYPVAVADLLMRVGHLSMGDVVADIGAGTGLFTRMLLEQGLRVRAIEPNAAMRAAADAMLGGGPGYSSGAGTAEHTGLADAGVRLVTVAQAFHWLDATAARVEFSRILTPGGCVAVVFNLRRTDTPLTAGYEALLQHFAPEYPRVGLRPELDESAVAAFFAPGFCQRHAFAHVQHFDRNGLRGRLLSSSFVPAAGTRDHERLCIALDALFERCQSGGSVEFGYRCVVFVGALDLVQS